MSRKNKKKFGFRQIKLSEPVVNQRDREVEASLRTIYASEEGLPDLTKLEKKKSHRWILVAIFVPLTIILLCGAAWTGFWFFKSFDGFTGKGLILSVEGPNQISLGQETTYFINYQNPLREPLASVEVRVNFPSDFTPTGVAPPSSEKNLVWKLGALAAEERGTITIKGRFIGALGAISAIQAVATYRPANYSSDFEAMATEQITYADTVMEGWLEVPEKAIPGDSVSVTYHLKNKGQDSLDKMEARVVLPEGFTLHSATGSHMLIEGRTCRVALPSLQAGSSTEITLNGVFASGFGGQAKVTAQAGTLGADGGFLSSQIAEAGFPVLAGDLSLKLIVNGSDAVERSVSYGDRLQYAIGYENMADEALKNVTVRLLLETVDLKNHTPQKPVMVDWDKSQTAVSSTRRDQTLIWNPSKASELKEIPPGSSGSLEATIPLLMYTTGTGLATVRATVFADIDGIGNSKIKRTIQIAPMFFKLRSDAALIAEARYYSEEGAPLGSGPLPPKVGQATRYRIFWSINKHIHALKDIGVTTILPRNVSFITQVTSTAGAMVYDMSTRTVSWKLNRLPESMQNADMEFDVELTPTASDDGRFVDLIEDATFQAFDEIIQENILQVTKALDTDLQNDDGAKGKGVVRK